LNEKTGDLQRRLLSVTQSRTAKLVTKQEDELALFLEKIENEVPRFPIAHFEEHFLSYFLSGDYTPEMIEAWVRNVAGTPLSPVHLVDDEGEVVITVPGLIDSSQINPDPGPSAIDTIGHIAGRYEQERHNIPALAIQRLEERLVAKIKDKVHLSRMTVEFFQYYQDRLNEKINDTEQETFSPRSIFE
jgi:hypothetical protein